MWSIPHFAANHLQRLESAGINVGEVEQRGQLELCDWEQAYFPRWAIRSGSNARYVGGAVERPARNGYARTRLVAHMEWALEDREVVCDLIEYEARFNFVHDSKDLVICAYDLTKIRGDVIMDDLRTHPMIIVGGILQENPFFLPPEQFLREMRESHARHAHSN